MSNSYIRSIGHYLPKNIVTNYDLQKDLDTSDEWIFQRTGIKQRHIVDELEMTSDIAYKAALVAIDNSCISKEDIDLIIVATTTPDRTFPSVATIVQNKLGIKQCAAFDVQAVCSGFIYAVDIADSYIKTGKSNNILVIGAESMSRIVDWSDRSTCILFGDGAGAFILSKTDSGNGIIASNIYSDGSYGDMLYTSGGVCVNNHSGVINMNGRELMRLAVEKMSESILSILTKNNLSINDVDHLIPHQANSRILAKIAEKIQISNHKVINSIKNHANTSAASIPIAMSANINKFKRGDLIIFTAFGGGLTWGSCLIRY